MKARYIIIPVVILAVITAVVLWVARGSDRQPEYELFEVRRGSVAKTVSVSGSVVSREKLELGFLAPGIVREVAIQIGSQVSRGDLLVALDTEVLRYQAAQAWASVAAAQAMLDKTRDGLRLVDQSVLNQTINNAKVALSTAQANLQDAYRTRDMELSNARTALDGARAAYTNALNVYNASGGMISQSVEIAKVALSNTLAGLRSAQSYYQTVLSLYNAGQATISELQSSQAQLNSANAAYLSARANYDAALQRTSVERAAAKANLDAARVQLDNANAAYDASLVATDLKVNNAKHALSAAQAAYDLTSAQYNQASAPAHRYDISAAAAQVAAGAAAARSIEAQIAKAKLLAPIDGVITAVDAQVGELTNLAGPVVVLETAQDFLVEANISEVDVDQIELGQSVAVGFDSLSDVLIRGTVVSIDPAATVILGVINYRIQVALDQLVVGLRPSMTAELEVLTEQRDNVLWLPRRALDRSDDGYTVKILVNDTETEERNIDIDLVGDNEVEVIAGLTEGERVVLREL